MSVLQFSNSRLAATKYHIGITVTFSYQKLLILKRFSFAISIFSPIFTGTCEFPREWAGGWFQSGVQSIIQINSTFIVTKGECHQEQGEKVVVYDR